MRFVWKWHFGIVLTTKSQATVEIIIYHHKAWYMAKEDVVHSYPPSAAYMRQWIGSALVQIMACRLFGAKPLSKPMLGYCQLDHLEQT